MPQPWCAALPQTYRCDATWQWTGILKASDPKSSSMLIRYLYLWFYCHVRKLTNPYTDPEWKGSRSQVSGFLFFYSDFDWMFRGILTSSSFKVSSGYSERQTGIPQGRTNTNRVLKLTSFLWMVFLIHPSGIWLLVPEFNSDFYG